jgi:hypothetical protein
VSISADGVLENLKQVRDLLVSFRELVDRKDKLAADNSDVLKKRISTTKTKLTQNKGVPGMESEVDRLMDSLRLVKMNSVEWVGGHEKKKKLTIVLLFFCIG